MSDDRPNALLTQTDREYLRGEKKFTGQYAKQMRYERRQALLERLGASLEDLVLLMDSVDKISPQIENIQTESWDEAYRAIRALHPDPPDSPEPQLFRSIAEDLSERADRLEALERE